MPRKRRLRPNWPLIAAILATILALGSLVVWQSSMRIHQRGFSASSWKLAVVESCMETVTAAWFLATGASIGSFLNVVAWRAPRGVSLLIPSRCPYCCTKLSFKDNFPVFGWLKLRGRCRTCRLPISPRYLYVELLLMAVFGWTFFNEYLTLGGNLPTQPFLQTMLLEDRLLKTPFGLQILLYLWVESGLIVVALATLQGSIVPWRVFFWTALPSILMPITTPSMIQVPWRAMLVETMTQERIEVCLTILFGIAMGWALGRLVSIVADSTRPSFSSACSHRLASQIEADQFEASQIEVSQIEADPPATHHSGNELTSLDHPRQRTIRLGLAVAGGLLGWQAAIIVALLTLFITWTSQIVLLSRLWPRALQGWRDNAPGIGNISSWIWLAVLIFRSTWIYWARLFG